MSATAGFPLNFHPLLALDINPRQLSIVLVDSCRKYIFCFHLYSFYEMKMILCKLLVAKFPMLGTIEALEAETFSHMETLRWLESNRLKPGRVRICFWL